MIVFLMIAMFYVQDTSSGYIEKVEVSGCETCRLMLTCRQLDSIIAILDVELKIGKPVIDSAFRKNTFIPFPPDHPIDALKKRCSGLNHCSFILSEDSPGSELWGAGNISIKYACVTQDRIKRYCNSETYLTERVPSGIVHNPGYPRFYAGQKRCTWKITAPKNQKLKLQILDIALFDTVASSPEECKDVLEIKDTGQTIYSTCKQEHPPAEILSATDSVEIVLSSRQIFNPRRGVLIYYSAIGCQLPPPPKEGYLVFKNDTLATYTCRRGLAFPDTWTKSKTIRCSGSSWNITLPLLDCEESNKLVTINLLEVVRKLKKMDTDLIAPVVIILLLFALNAGIVFYIQKARKRQATEVTDEELATFSRNK